MAGINDPDKLLKVQLNDFSRENATRAHKQSGFAGTSPAILDLFKAAEWDLLKVAEQRDMKILELTKVRAANVKGESRVYIYPTDKNDVAGIEVRRYNGTARINLGPQLAKWDLALPIHHKEWFHLNFADAAESPVGPALYFDLDKPYKSRTIRRKGQATPAASAAAATDPQTPIPDSEQ